MFIKTVCEKQIETTETAEYFHGIMEMLRREQKEDKTDPEKTKPEVKLCQREAE